MKRFSFPKSVSKFTTKSFYEIDSLIIINILLFEPMTSLHALSAWVLTSWSCLSPWIANRSRLIQNVSSQKIHLSKTRALLVPTNKAGWQGRLTRQADKAGCWQGRLTRPADKAGWQGRQTRQADKAGWQGRLTRQADKAGWQGRLTRRADKAGWQGRLTWQADKAGRPGEEMCQFWLPILLLRPQTELRR